MTQTKNQKQFILTADLTKVMWKLSLPAILGMVLYGLNAFMDTIYIGQLLSETALSGVALAYPLTAMAMGVGSWVGTGAGNHLSILLGKNDQAALKKVLPNTSLLTIIISLIFAVPSYYFATPLIQMMGGEGEILTYGVRYFKITLLAFPIWVYGLQLNMMIRAEGKMMTAALHMAYGLILNLVLTPITIIYLDMDVDGAAWATNLAMMVYCIVGHLYFARGKSSFPCNIHKIFFDKSVSTIILKLGFPGFILSLMGLIQAIVVFNTVVNYGNEDDLAFFAAANRILLFLLTPLFGLMRALQPIEGVNFGAQQFSRVKKSFLLFSKTGLWLVLPFWLFLMCCPELAIQLVLPNKVMTLRELIDFRVYMAIIPFLPFVFMSLTHLPAIEQPKYASIIGIARQLIFYVPMMLLLPKWMGISGVYYGATLIDMVIALWLGYIVFKSFKNLGENKQATLHNKHHN